MIKYFTINNKRCKVDFFCEIEKEYKNAKRDGKTWVYVFDGYDWSTHFLSVYYRPERTWNDHMGNTDCGYYVNVPVLGKKKRVYMF